MQAATKGYVDTQVGGALPKARRNAHRPLTLAADPASSLQAATKQYVDKRVLRTGDTLTGALMLAADPTTTLQAATKGYVDTQLAGALPKTGGTLTGVLTLAADPTLSLQAATKHYVDAQAALSLPISGGTLTGPLSLPSNPASALQAAPKQYVDSQVAAALPLAGGTLSGALTLAGDPTSALQAATKRYVDAAGGGTTGVINVRSAPYNAQLNGVTDDTAAFKAAYQAAAPGSVIYVPNGVTVMQSPPSWGIALTKRVKWIVDGTALPDGTPLSNAIPGGGSPANNYLPGLVVGNSSASAEVSQNGSQATDFAVSHSSYIVNHSGGPTGGAVIANTRNDTIIYNSPANFVWGGVDRLLWCGSQTPSGAPTAEHVGRYVQTIRQNFTLGFVGQATAATTSVGRLPGIPRYHRPAIEQGRAASMTVEMDWFGNGPDDGNRRQIQSLVVGQHNTSGTPVEISSVIGVYLAAGCTGHAYRVFNINIPFSTSVLDTTNAQQMAGAAAIRMAAGHAIAFEPTNSNRLAYDAATNTLRWYQGTLSFPVGKGITVGWFNVYASNATLPNYLAGNIIFLVGSTPFTITLPAASGVAAGTGFTFSVLGSANVTIATTGGDTVDNAPLHFGRTIATTSSPMGVRAGMKSSGPTRSIRAFPVPPTLPSYTVAALPASPGAGAMAFASNGRKPSEAAGVGTGVEVFNDGGRWISVCNGLQVAA